MPSVTTSGRRLRRLFQLVRAAAGVTSAARQRSQARSALMTPLSPGLRAFVDEMPEERDSLLAFVSSVGSRLTPGTRLLDAGAGNAPYRELFAHCDYVTADWENSPHEHGTAVDIIGSLHDLPVADASFDAVLCTQVLEHVADPLAVLSELRRVTRPGGQLLLTVPLVWPLHEEPYDFFRYTSHGLRHLLTTARFEVVSITARNGCFTTLAGLLRTSIGTIWDTDDPRAPARLLADRLARTLTHILPVFDELDERRLLPLGYNCVAVRPEP